MEQLHQVQCASSIAEGQDEDASATEMMQPCVPNTREAPNLATVDAAKTKYWEWHHEQAWVSQKGHTQS